MLTWMIYAVSVSAVLSAATLVAEFSARQRRSSTRWIWLLAILASLVIPSVMTSVSIDVPAAVKLSVPKNVIALHEITSARLSPEIWVDRYDGGTSIVQHSESYAKGMWTCTSVLLILALMASAAHLQWRRRQWTKTTVCGVSVYLSIDIGPAVVGLIRPRIVLPVWLLDSPKEQQAAVLAHEHHTSMLTTQRS